jgi:hypothetical protein
LDAEFGRGGLGDSAPETKKPLVTGALNEADARTRTGDPFITSEVLYQLSYVGVAVKQRA